jgi:hypothetical protein
MGLRRPYMKLTEAKLKELIAEVIDEGWAITKKNRLSGQNAGAGSLRPRQMKKPGDGAKAASQGQELHGWDKYIQLAAEQYANLPNETPEGRESYEAFAEHIQTLYPKVTSAYNVSFVDDQPYRSGRHMSKAVTKTGDFKVSRQFIQSDDPEEMDVNLKNRAVHDFFGHLNARGHEKGNYNAFSFMGEIKAYQNQLRMASPDAVPFLYVVLVGQLCYFYHYGENGPVKFSLMPDFDPINLGRVAGYRITQDGDLEKE